MSFVSRYLEPNLVERLNHLQLTARRVVEGSISGQHRSPTRGASIEFRQHRIYAPGDEPRRLDWRVLARTDRPYIKEYDQETNLRCAIMLDASGSMSYAGKSGPKFDYAARMAAALAYLMLGQSESVGLAVFDAQLRQWLAPHAGTAQLSRIIDALERAAAHGPAQIAAALRQAADRLGRRALIIVVSDFFAPILKIREGLARLRHDRHELLILQVLDRDELEFPFGRWCRFRGLEGERGKMVEPALARKTYLANFARHQNDLRGICHAVGAEFQSFVTDHPLDDSLTRFLQRRLSI